MRITAGYARGILLNSPKGDATRPATDAARLAVFSSLGEFVEGSKVLDIFAGTGAYGLEAASRGANKIVLVENSSQAFKVLKSNISTIAKFTKAKISPLFADCFKCTKNLNGETFDLIFADPPYALLKNTDFEQKLALLFDLVSSESSIIILEAPADYEPNADIFKTFEIFKRLGKKSKGKPSQIFLKKLTPISQNENE
ncbi:MAG: 16S rRNA (guanine(966)-N(2))-methyltransferase RsmD [Verrucomicrobiaceae bacterium]|nr:16S rRNA (guanine(966)-N(2))-methyltransferase RsmD [Verrucomicrobiaceae bacterium]